MNFDKFTLEDALDKYIVGQKRTSPNRQFVFLVDDKIVIRAL